MPQAGPRTGSAGSSFGSVSSNGDAELAVFLEAEHDGETWDLVVGSAQTASGLIADQGVSVMALGGFMGSDPAMALADFADLVESGAVRHVLVSGGRPEGRRLTETDTTPVLDARTCLCHQRGASRTGAGGSYSTMTGGSGTPMAAQAPR